MGAKQHAMHGRDHLPNGCDPIPGGSALKWAQVSYGQQVHSISGSLIRIRWQQLDTNDTTVFSLVNTSSDTIRGGGAEWADWLNVSEDGLYQIFTQINHPTSAFASNVTTIKPIFYDGFSYAALEQLTTYDWNTGNALMLGSQYNSDVGWGHTGLWCVNMIWHEAAEDGANPLKLGLQVGTAKTGTAEVGGSMFVVQLTSGATPAVTRESI